jgi:hypothetical protein
MELKVIAFSMTAILIILFVAAHFLAPKEKERMKIEYRYSELILQLTDRFSKENDEIKSLGLKLGKSMEEIERDINVVLSKNKPS